MKKTLEDIIISQMCTINDSHMMYVSWDMECNRQKFLTFWIVFSPFIPPKNQKNQNFEKMKKKPWDIIIYTCVTIIWYMVPKISNTMDRTFCHFGPFFALLPPSQPQKMKILKKWKKAPADIIILHMCMINNNHMIYDFWDMKCDRQNFLSFWNVFSPYSPKKWNFEKLIKTPGYIIILHMCTKNIGHMMYDSWNIVRNRRTNRCYRGRCPT